MAAIIDPHYCSKCFTIDEITDCEGCKKRFCTKHLTKHREELSSELRSHKIEHSRNLQQLLDRELMNRSSKKVILAQINQWERNMIERIRHKAESARDRLEQLTDNGQTPIIQNAQELINKINTRNDVKDPFEEDIEQLKQSIIDVKQIFNKLIQRSNIELYIEPSHMIDWNHLIYLREKSTNITNPLPNKQSINSVTKFVKDSIDSRQQQKAISKHNSESSSSSSSSDNEDNSHETVNIPIEVLYQYFPLIEF